MSGRGASAGVLTELAKRANEPVHLFELYLDDQTVRITDAARQIAWGGNDYIAAGHLIGFDGLEESAELQVTSVKVQLSGVVQDTIALLLTHAYIDRRLAIYTAFVSGAGVVIDPVPIFDGRCDSPSIDEDPENGKCLVTLTAAQHWVDFERRPGRHTNHEEQQLWFPGDRFFEFVSGLNREIKWGSK